MTKHAIIRASRRGVPGWLHTGTRQWMPIIAGGEPTPEELRQRVEETRTAMQTAYDALEAADPTADGVDIDALTRTFDDAEAVYDTAVEARRRFLKMDEARNQRLDPESPSVTITREPLTYERSKKTTSYFLDLARVQMGRGDVEGATKRLAAHETEQRQIVEARDKVAEIRLNRELDEMLGKLPQELAQRIADAGMVERRDITRVDGAGGHFVPPIWLLDEYAAFQRAGRPFVDACRNIPLPPGTDSINIPRITTGTLTAAQTADNAAVAEQDLVDAIVTAPVRTIAGQEDVALQLLEQSPLAFDEVVYEDLIRDYYLQCDQQAIAGSGASGQVLGILNVAGVNAITYTDASPTVPELYPKIADGLNQGETNRKAPLTHGWLAPRRFWWTGAALDANSRPFVVPTMQGLAMNAAGVSQLGGDTIEDQALLMLAPFRKDHSIPINLGGGTNEDRIILTRNRDHLWFEGTLRARAMSEVLSGNLTVRLQVYSYVAFTAARFPAGTSVISGTGLVTPTF